MVRSSAVCHPDNVRFGERPCLSKSVLTAWEQLLINVAMFALIGGPLHFCRSLKKVEREWISGYLGGVLFYFGREVVQHIDYDTWDIPGLCWPSIGLTVIFVISSLGSAMMRTACSQERFVSLKYMVSCASVAAFLTILGVVVSCAEEIRYFVKHLLVSVLIFLTGASTHHLVVTKLRLLEGVLFSAWWGSLPFFLGWEISQQEDYDYWDWPGILAPVGGSTLLCSILVLLRKWVRSRADAERLPSEKADVDPSSSVHCPNDQS